jgi:hypothetical protein
VAFHRRSWSHLDESKKSARNFSTARLFWDNPGFVKVLMLKESSQSFFDAEMEFVGGGNTNENRRPLQLNKL